MNPPDIDSRRPRDIVGEILGKAPFYTPEWNPSAPHDAGRALTGIFGDMVFEVIHRLNQVPERHLAAFLNLLGLRQVPPQPAEAVAAFILAKDAGGSVTIPAATQVAVGKTEEHGELVFETEEVIVAVPAKLTALYSAIPAPDRGEEKIHRHSEALADGRSFELFHDEVNVQDHALYIGHGELLQLASGGRITLAGLPPGLADQLEWSYTTPGGGLGSFTAVASAAGVELTTATGRPATAASTVHNLTSTWIKASPATLSDGSSTLLQVHESALKNEIRMGVASLPGAAILPRMAVAGDVPLDLTTEAGGNFKTALLPFGDRPAALATFHLASDEVFSKKGATVTLAVSSAPPVAGDAHVIHGSGTTNAALPQPGLSWEYWNGRGWTVIRDVADTTGNLLVSGTIIFTCPLDIARTQVAGQDGYWIRVRLASGDYGREFQVVGNTVQAVGFTPPWITGLTLSYAHAPGNLQRPQRLLSLNNLEWEDAAAVVESGHPFKPFRPLPDDHPTLYLGFDRALSGGPVSLFVNLVEQDYPRDFRPLIRWQSYDGAAREWRTLTVKDDTADLTKAGLVHILLPQGGTISARFGHELFWIRAVLVQGAFVPARKAAAEALNAGEIDARFFAGYLKWREQLMVTRRADLAPLSRPLLVTGAREKVTGVELATTARREGNVRESGTLLEVSFRPNSLKINPPLVATIVLNAAKVRELVTVRDERLGSGSGLPGHRFTFARRPVFAEEVWVNEAATLPKAELDAFKDSSPERVREVLDRQGTVKEIWVRWEGRDDLLQSSPTDRHYALDRSTGEMRFGDGRRGRVLPAGRNNLKASYRTGGGVAGNIKAGEIARIKTAVPLVAKVVNPAPAGGGVEGETVAAVCRRGPNTIRHRYRAVSAEDYEHLIRESFPGLCQVRCLPTFNDEGKTKTGWVTVILVPEADEDRPVPSVELRRRVEDFLVQHAANVVTAPRHAVVIKPSYVQVSVTTRLVPTGVDQAPAVEAAATAALAAFLHPVRGGWSGAGWPFGRLVCFSDLHALLERVDGVDRVASLAAAVSDEFGNATALAAAETAPVALPAHVLVSSGKHRVEAR
jgi:hypothetical protein